MDFDKKDWEKKLKNFLLDDQYKTEDENLGMIFKTKGKHSDYIRIFYKNQRYLYFRYRKSLKRSKNEYALSTEISFEADLHYIEVFIFSKTSFASLFFKSFGIPRIFKFPFFCSSK